MVRAAPALYYKIKNKKRRKENDRRPVYTLAFDYDRLGQDRFLRLFRRLWTGCIVAHIS